MSQIPLKTKSISNSNSPWPNLNNLPGCSICEHKKKPRRSEIEGKFEFKEIPIATNSDLSKQANLTKIRNLKKKNTLYYCEYIIAKTIT